MKQVEEQVKQCQVCAKEARCSKEPMIASQLPDYPWQKVGSDLFESGGSTFLLVVDYFSRLVEISKMTTTSSSSVITALKSIFARYGMPEIDQRQWPIVCVMGDETICKTIWLQPHN